MLERSGAAVARDLGVGAACQRQHAQGLVGHGLVGGHELGATLLGQRNDPVAVVDMGAQADHHVGRALGVLLILAVQGLDDHGHHLAARVERGLAHARVLGSQASKTSLAGIVDERALGRLAHGLAQRAVGNRHGALPAGFLLLLARHHAAEEVERRVDEVVAQVAGGCADVLCGEVVADVLQRGGFHQFVGVGQGRGGRHDDLLEIADAHCLIVLGPVDGIVGLLEIGLLRGVVHGGDVAQFDARPVFLGQLRFDRQHAGDGLVDVGLGNARQPEDFAQILLVGGADRLVLGIEVVVAVAHDQVGLRGVERVDVAVHQVGLHAHAEERIGDRGVEPGHCGGQLRAVADGENSVDGGLDRSGALGVQAHRVEPHLVEVRNLLLDASRLGFLLRHAGEQLVDALLVVVAQDVERTVARIFGLQGVVLLPAARGVLVEIGVGGYRQIEVRHVEGRGLGGILTGCHASHCCCEKNDFFHVVRGLIKRGLP